MAETAAPTEETEPASPEEPDVKIDISPMAGAAAVREPASVPFEKPEVKGMVPLYTKKRIKTMNLSFVQTMQI